MNVTMQRAAAATAAALVSSLQNLLDQLRRHKLLEGKSNNNIEVEHTNIKQTLCLLHTDLTNIVISKDVVDNKRGLIGKTESVGCPVSNNLLDLQWLDLFILLFAVWWW